MKVYRKCKCSIKQFASPTGLWDETIVSGEAIRILQHVFRVYFKILLPIFLCRDVEKYEKLSHDAGYNVGESKVIHP